MPLVALIAIAALIGVVVGFGSGWGVKHWKDGEEIAQVKADKAAIESQNAILVTANTNCATDIEGVKKGMALVVEYAEEREKVASEAMKAADLQITKRKAAIKIAQLPPVAPTPEAQCAAMIREQIDYVRERQNAP